MNNIPLKKLDWFSFNNKWYELKDLSLFQAVAYIMRIEPDLVSLGKEYQNSITKHEIKSAQEVYERYRETTDQLPTDTFIKEFDYRNICIPESEISGDENLHLLYYDRFGLTEGMGVTISVIFSALQSEIEKYKSDGKTSLEIITKHIGGYDEFYFNRESLKNWKSLSTIKEVRRLDVNIKSTKKPRYDAIQNQKLTTGMLIHLLINQPLINKHGEEVKFIKGSGNINFSKFYDTFEKEFLDKDLSYFPEDRTVFKNLKEAYKEFVEDVRLKK